jgi:hypothetical protein
MMLGTEIESASGFAAIRFTTADVRESSVYHFAASGMVTKSRDTISDVSLPVVVISY